MEIMDFAQQFLQPYAVKGTEIVPTHCPFCHGGQSRDKHTFALSISNRTYNCKRGSCGVTGHFSKLCREFGVEADSDSPRPVQKKYKKPEKIAQRVTTSAAEYLTIRKMSPEVVTAFRIGVDSEGNLVFPYFTKDGEHVCNKFRAARKLQPGERKMWRETGTMPALFGMHLYQEGSPLTLTEGEFDAMSCHEAGIPNACSVPNGAEDFTWLDTSWDFVQLFNEIYIFGDNDRPGQEMVRRLSAKLSDKRVFIVRHEFKDANELLFHRGKDAVYNAWKAAEEVPVFGLLNLAEVLPINIDELESIGTSLPPLDKLIGGFYYGDVTVWTGKRGEGKSTLLSQLMLDAVQDGKKVCAYSGELRADRFQYWTDLQAAGKQNIQEFFDPARDRSIAYVPKEIREKIHLWYDRRYWLYDNSVSDGSEESGILKVFETAAKRYDCRVFLVDNLMTADYGRLSDSDFFRQQSRFVGQLVTFANKYNVHVHLVAHPRKTQSALTNDDVSGSGDITNRASNVIALAKAKAESGFQLSLEVTKNRWEGSCGTVGLAYCNKSHRIYVPSIGDVVRYGWGNMIFEEYEGNEELPWT